MAPEAGPSVKRRRLDNLEEYTVLVGPEEEAFIVSKAILSKSSNFLARCCENYVQTVRLSRVKVEIFEVYLSWLYVGKLNVTDENDREQESTYKHEGYDTEHNDLGHGETEDNCCHRECIQFETLLQLSYFANEFEDVKFGNAVVDAVVKLAEDAMWEPCGHHVKAIYARLPEDSGLRKLVVDLFCAGYDPLELQDRLKMYPPMLFYEIWCRIHATTGGYSRVTRPTVRYSRLYHQSEGVKIKREPGM